MPKPCSLELRERVVDAVELGASRREAADWFEVSPSSAIKWMQRRQATGSIAPKPSGGSISPLEAHAAFLFTLIARQPDLTLDEIVAAMHKRRIAGSRSAVWRFLQRHKISVKKKSAGGGARAGGRGARRRWMREQGMFDPARLVFLDETATSTNMVRLRGRCPRGQPRAVRVLEAEFALAALVGDYDDTDMAARLQRPNSTSSASGFLMCSLITRAIGRAPISSSSAET